MKGYFYHNSIRKYVLLMGNLFSNIYVARGDEYRKVPITVSSKEQFVAALNSQELNGDNSIAKVATMLPRIGLDMVSCTYDSTRKTNITNRKLSRDVTGDRPKSNTQFNPVPYDFEFEVSLYTRHQDDAFQIIEQILPYFQPQFNVMIKELNESEVVVDQRDIPIILESAVPETTFEGGAGEMRHIEWTLNMRMKGWLYPPTSSQFGEIRTIYLDFNDEEQVIIHAERVPVESTSEFTWLRRSEVSLDYEASWRSSVDSLYDVEWDYQPVVEASYSTDWYQRPQVDAEYEHRFNVRSEIDLTLESAWDYQTVVDGVYSVEWDYQSVVDASYSIEWDYQSVVDASYSIEWDYQSVVDAGYSTEWDYQSVVDASYSTEWDYPPSTVVDASYSTEWSRRSEVSAYSNTLWESEDF
ncbi:tail sheath stabilizer [Vibrio phage 1.081.O._10N.286.52.C2]|nr:tail sheath stabilizer [Vibrio phage 1.081.O._10N.286.52.C2]